VSPPLQGPALKLTGIDKSFGRIHANRDISVAFAPGSIHGVIGENGAGKSTLMRIIYGLQRPDAGLIEVAGKTVTLRSPQDAITAGIAMVHQHFMLVERFTVLENIILGTEPSFGMRRALTKARDQVARLGSEYGLALPLDRRVRDLSMGERQSVEILKALYRNANILILDEPTSVLTYQQSERLFEMLRALRDAGRTIILVSHKLKEIMSLTDHVTVLRQGEVVGESATATTDPDALAKMMVGGSVELGRVGGSAAPGSEVLEAVGVTIVDGRGLRVVDNVDVSVRQGEIVAIAGVAGNGQSELLRALAGMLPIDSGKIMWHGRELLSGERTPSALRRLGLAHVPEAPRRFGMIADFTAAETMILGYEGSPPASRGWVLDLTAIDVDCRAKMVAFDIKPGRPELPTAAFSGGNQQKLILARELSRNPELILIGEPTQGVDIGAVASIQARLAALRREGKAALLVTADTDQIRALADRILVMSGGRIVGELAPDAATDTRLGLMMGGVGQAAS
jgi:simple sugar transport system ATP-binding protein